MNRLNRVTFFVASGVAISLLSATEALAATNYVKNGSFETNTGIGQIRPSNGTSTSPNIDLQDWTKIVEKDSGSQGFAFVINKDADSSGFPSIFSPPTIKVWGPPNNSFPTGSTTNAPDGDFWVGIDGDYGRSSIFQQISGLTAGKEYDLSFVWAGGQFTDQQGATNQHWDYTLEGTTYSTTTVQVPSKGFEGWFKVIKKFVASGNPFDLKFTAYGSAVSSGSLPPFLMLDSVRIEDPGNPPITVPGPLPVLGLGAAFGLSRQLRRRVLGANHQKN